MPSLIGLFIARLNRGGMDYAVTGGLAAIVYGHPRMTLDVDLVLQLGRTSSSTFESLWPSDEFYCPPASVIDEERARAEHGHFNVIHHDTAMRADIYLAGINPFQTWALTHAVEREIQGERVRFAPIDYVIVYKLRFAQQGASDRHLHDIARMIEVNEEIVGGPDLDRWIDTYGVRRLWERAQALAGAA